MTDCSQIYSLPNCINLNSINNRPIGLILQQCPRIGANYSLQCRLIISAKSGIGRSTSLVWYRHQALLCYNFADPFADPSLIFLPYCSRYFFQLDTTPSDLNFNSCIRLERNRRSTQYLGRLSWVWVKIPKNFYLFKI